MSRNSTSAKSIFDDDDDELEALKGGPKWNREESLARQNKDIEELSQHVSAVSHMTGMIYDQIVDSHRNIDNLQNGMDSNQSRLEHITARTKNMVNRAGGPRYCCIIVFLSIVAFILFLLVLYT